MKQADKQPSTRISRRALLQTAALCGLAGSLPALSEDRPATQKPQLQLKKRTKEAVKYQDTPYLGRTCAKCMLYAGDGQCVILDGPVSPDGWCNQWIPPTLGGAPVQPSEQA